MHDDDEDDDFRDDYILTSFQQDEEDNASQDGLLLLLLLTAGYLVLTVCCSEITFTDEIGLEGRRNRKGHIRRASLQHPRDNAFWTLYNSKHDDSLICLTGFDHETFHHLHLMFKPYFDKYTPYQTKSSQGLIVKRRFNVGRHRHLTSISCLALGLAWTRHVGSDRHLQMHFGLTRSSLSTWVRFARRIIIKVLIRLDDAAVRLPTDNEIYGFMEAIEQKYPLLKDCWGAMDGLKLRIQRPGGDNKTQSLFYNGWTHGHYITNLFLFSPDGKIRSAYFNLPGCLHDSTLANWSCTYDHVDQIYERTGGKIVVDSAFKSSDSKAMYKSYQQNFDRGGRVRQNTQLNREATALRQMAEWGMRGLQGSFPRLHQTLKYEEIGERKLIMQMIILLYNYRASRVGQNQIRSSFMPWLERMSPSVPITARTPRQNRRSSA